LDYWPKHAKVVQVDADAKMLGLVKPISVGICADAGAAARALLARLSTRQLAGQANRAARAATIADEKRAWETELDGWTHEKDAWSLDVSRDASAMHPRQGAARERTGAARARR